MACSGIRAKCEKWVFPLSLICSLFLVAVQAGTIMTQEDHLHPVILVPGLGGSQLEAHQDIWGDMPFRCRKVGWYHAYINPFRMGCVTAACLLNCTVDELSLRYDPVSHRTSNNPQVDVRVPNFGEVDPVEYLIPNKLGPLLHSQSGYYDDVVDLLQSMGYTKDFNIRGAPYDFRRAPNEMDYFYDDLVKLVESTFRDNGNQRVILLAHSMGNLHMLYFLNRMDQAWKDAYIESFISIAGPWGGAVKTVQALASGDNLDAVVHIEKIGMDLDLIKATNMRPLERSMPSMSWMTPSDTFWTQDEVLVKAPGGVEYTVNDFQRFYEDIGFAQGFSIKQDTVDLIRDLTPPGVETFCMTGIDVPTRASLDYTASTAQPWYNEDPEQIMGDGDGTVNRRSAEGCLRWVGNQEQPVHHTTFKGATHMTLLSDEAPLKYIQDVITKANSLDHSEQLTSNRL